MCAVSECVVVCVVMLDATLDDSFSIQMPTSVLSFICYTLSPEEETFLLNSDEVRCFVYHQTKWSLSSMSSVSGIKKGKLACW